jgi:hypothetical protein
MTRLVSPLALAMTAWIEGEKQEFVKCGSGKGK